MVGHDSSRLGAGMLVLVVMVVVVVGGVVVAESVWAEVGSNGSGQFRWGVVGSKVMVVVVMGW